MSRAKKEAAMNNNKHTIKKKVHSKKQIQRAAQMVNHQNGQLRGLLKEIEIWMGDDLLAQFEEWRKNPDMETTLGKTLENK